MSECQYYEWQAVDRPLTEAEHSAEWAEPVETGFRPLVSHFFGYA